MNSGIRRTVIRRIYADVGACAIAAVLASAACEPVDRFQERFRAATPHEAYVRALARAGLAGTALARDWIAAGQRALAQPVGVEPPYRETGHLPPRRPAALGFQFEIERGQRMVIEVDFTAAGGSPGSITGGPAAAPSDNGSRAAAAPQIFIDLYRMGGDSTNVPYHEATADSGALRLVHEPWRGGTFVLRVQPELLRGGRYTITIHKEPTLAFPVEDADTRDIRSVFGDPRDGGSREHHGVDIFAPRGTPALAAVAGTVRGVRTTDLGGNVVWLRDREHDQSLYYAHLDSQLVSNGQRVEPGDTLGLIGNSGNARTTPPHLHFGVYRRGSGPVDPFPYLFTPDTVPEPVDADVDLVGDWARVARGGTRLREAPGANADLIAELPDRTALRIIAATGEWFRVRLPDGRTGHVLAQLAEAVDGAVAERVVDAPAGIRARPRASAPVIHSIAADVPVPVLGRFGDFLFVRAPDGLTGWLAADAGAGQSTRETQS